METQDTLLFDELEQMDAPLEWWQRATYIIGALGGLVAIAT